MTVASFIAGPARSQERVDQLIVMARDEGLLADHGVFELAGGPMVGTLLVGTEGHTAVISPSPYWQNPSTVVIDGSHWDSHFDAQVLRDILLRGAWADRSQRRHLCH